MEPNLQQRAPDEQSDPQPRPGDAELARQIVDVLVDRQAADVTLLDLTALSTFADYFVIATAGNDRHMGALIDAIVKLPNTLPGLHVHQEGESADGWVLLDCGAVIVHLFTEDQRAHYDLEGLWSRAQQIVRVQ
jgi:ribosome-associated protein